MTSVPSGPLAVRNFRFFAASDVVSTLGSAIAVVALPFAVLSTGGGAAGIGVVTTANLVLMAAFFLVGGVVSDRVSRLSVMVTGNVVQAVAQLGSAALVLSGWSATWSLAVLAALRGVGVGIYFPAATGLVAQILPAPVLGRANAISRSSRSTAQIVGAGLGGVLVSVVGPGWGLAIDGASYVLAGLLRLGMRMPPAPVPPRASALHDLKVGWAEFRGRTWLWTGVLQFAVVAAAYQAAIGVLGPVVAQDSLGGARSWGWITAAVSIGAVAGGLVLVRYTPGRLLVAASLGLMLMSGLMFALAVPLPIGLVLAAAGLSGICREVFTINWATTLQSHVDQSVLSRISAYDSLGGYVLAPIGGAVAGPLAEAFGVRPVLLCCGVLTVGTTAAALAVRDIRAIRPVAAVPERR
ncbi:MFS transporter [Actinophytocola sp. KF-1]